MHTVAPARASATAMARPIPREAPVTSAARPVNAICMPALAVKSHEVVPPGPHCEAGGCESTITAAKEARVDIHKNARTTTWSRAEIIRQVREFGQSIRAVARTFHVTPKTARTWVRRADERLSDRSSRPHHVPGATPPELVGEVERLRRQRWTAVEIAARLQLGRSTV